MKRSDNKKRRAETTDMQSSCCKVLSIIGVDERGQMVLPKDVREMTNIPDVRPLSCEGRRSD